MNFEREIIEIFRLEKLIFWIAPVGLRNALRRLRTTRELFHDYYIANFQPQPRKSRILNKPYFESIVDL